MYYLRMQEVEILKILKRQDVQGKTMDLLEMTITENEISFLIGAGSEIEGDVLSLSTTDNEDIKMYDQINTFASHLWSTTHKPFPVTVSFEKKKETGK